ncbi:MAG: hypothetical protein RLZZ528_1379 [Pseudomonadota bacterium]
MSHTPHELADDFPGQADRIHALKRGDPHFARLATDYHEVNRAVHRAETRVDLLSEEEEEHLRKKRSLLKDQIARALA